MSSSSDNSNLPRVDFDKTETVGSTRWMRLETLSYHTSDYATNNNGDNTNTTTTTLRKWDRAVRTTKQSENSIDAVVILAILKNDPTDPTKDEIVCVKQFRPPVDSYTIELPAGLIDANEDVATAAMREFTEETGYIGHVVGDDAVLPYASYLSPGLTNESASLVRLEVDMTLERNVQIHNGQIENAGLEGCEKERGLIKLLLPRVGLLDALHELQRKEGVKVFAALYSLALGMSISEAAATVDNGAGSKEVDTIEPTHCTTTTVAATAVANADFPLVDMELDANTHNPTAATSHAVTSALRDSGFLVIKTPLLPLELQKRAMNAASLYLESSLLSKKVVMHPSDPKVYAMLQGIDSVVSDSSTSSSSVDDDTTTIINDLKEWYQALRNTKTLLLHCIAVGLGMNDDPNFFVKLHNENNDAIRLLKYPPGNANTGNRCKEHSDYGTLTLLLNDGVGGLEAFVHGEWRPVPYVEGAVVVNIGSILSEWTRQELKATLHRVAGPASIGSITPKETLLKAVAVDRISIAYFADPNGNVSTALDEGNQRNNNDAADDTGGEKKKWVLDNNGSKMSVSDYIRWRSGGHGVNRSGVAFTSTEESRLGILEDLLDKMPY